ncbi:MAG: DNA double-strand break repair nuclease NurA [Candidatus Thermoplasmatota archaeon]|nr:DNA double-strand break repair nuclease NurA [Candidatus Thermoplasmatota archaeon]
MNDLENLLSLIKKHYDTAESETEKIFDKLKIKPFDVSDEKIDLVAVDGSYTFLLNFSSVWIAVIRVGAVHYSVDNGFVLKDKKCVDRYVPVTVDEKIIETFPEEYQKLLKTIKMKTPNEIINEYRRILEHRIVNEMSKEKTECIIAVDGTLTTPFSKEFADRMNDTIKNCEKNNNILVGVSKDSLTHAFGSYFTDEELLNNFRDGLYYVKAPENFQKKYKPPLYGDVYFVRLYPKSKFFRIDIGTHKDEPEAVFSKLANYAKSSICPGYVYPLLEAHRYVVTVRQFKEIYENEILRIASKHFDINQIINAFTNVDGKRNSSFHSFLDRVSR